MGDHFSKGDVRAFSICCFCVSINALKGSCPGGYFDGDASVGLPGFSRCSSSRFWNGFSCCADGTLCETSLVGVGDATSDDVAVGLVPVDLYSKLA